MIEATAATPFDKARAAALRWLARREYSVAELGNRLKHKGYSDDVVDALLSALVDDRSLSDERYVDALVHVRTVREFGPLKIIAELRAAGVDDALIDAAISVDDVLWQGVAARLWRRRFATGRGDAPSPDTDLASDNAPNTDNREWRKQARFLEQRGFTPSQIRTVIGFPQSS